MGKKDKKRKYKKGKKGKKKKMSTGKKVLIGAGIAAVAIGGLYLGKYCYDKHKANQKNRLAHGMPAHGNRALVDDGPAPPYIAKYLGKSDPNVYKNSMETIPIPDAITVGLGWMSDNSTDYDVVAAAYNAQGICLGVVQGVQGRDSLFNGAITHTGDNDGTMVDTVLGDAENIIFDLRKVPNECVQILFGCTVVEFPQNIAQSKPYIHLLPLMREETVNQQIAAGGTRTIDYDSDDEGSFGDEYPTGSGYPTGGYGDYGTRGIGDNSLAEDGRDDFLTLYMSELHSYPAMQQQKGFVSGKIFKSSYGEWFFSPYRTVVNVDPQYGLFPAFDHYAKYPITDPQPSQPQQQQQQQNPYGYPPQQQAQGYGYGAPQQPAYGYPPQQQQPFGGVDPFSSMGGGYSGGPQPGYGYPPQQYGGGYGGMYPQ